VCTMKVIRNDGGIAFLVATVCWIWSCDSISCIHTYVLNAPIGASRRNSLMKGGTTMRVPMALASGYGIATNYSWKEDAYEIDLTVSVPSGTRAKDIKFTATSSSIALTVAAKEGSDNGVMTLLDPSRVLRGRVNVDGTYWVISDPDDDGDDRDRRSGGQNLPGSRRVTITIEKMIATPSDDFAVVDYDWKGIYRTEDADEVIERKYDKPEPLDVREYAASMGVDVDNINMSMVDKTMFNSGLNLTQRTLDELNQAGYLSPEEVTQQADGTEYVVNSQGEPVPVSLTGERMKPVPFLDTDSPWSKSTPRDVVQVNNETVVRQKRNFTRAAFAEDSAKVNAAEGNPKAKRKTAISEDPIDSLTVARLKEILKAQGQKTSGNKSELQERLRIQVNALLQGKQQDP
jgi:SAP domain/CS domain